MVIAVRTESGPDGLIIVKTAGTDAERLGLDREAELLQRAAHPGVVEVLDHSPDRLRLRHGGTTLRHLLPLAADHAAAVVCAVAEVVDAIHDAGVVHGQIDADHVVLDNGGRPRLCGFSKAQTTDGLSSDAAAQDVADLGAMFDELLDEAAHVPWTPANAGARHRTRRKHAREVFRNVAGMARRRDPRQRIAPHQMANAIREALPTLALPTPPKPLIDEDGIPVSGVSDLPDDAGALDDIEWSNLEIEYLAGEAGAEPAPIPSLPEPSAPEPAWTEPPTPEPIAEPGRTSNDEARRRLERALAAGPPSITIRDSTEPASERRRRRPPVEEPEPRRDLMMVGIALFVAGIILAPLAVWAFGTLDADDPADDTADASETDGTAPEGAQGDIVPTTWPSECDLPALTGPDIDDDGCPEPVTVNGRNVVVGERPIAFGEDGDLVAVGDTNCDGVVTPYLLRPPTGQVFVWAQWPLESAVQVRSSHDIDGATGIERRDGSQCDVIVVTGAGETVVAGTP